MARKPLMMTQAFCARANWISRFENGNTSTLPRPSMAFSMPSPSVSSDGSCTTVTNVDVSFVESRSGRSDSAVARMVNVPVWSQSMGTKAEANRMIPLPLMSPTGHS